MARLGILKRIEELESRCPAPATESPIRYTALSDAIREMEECSRTGVWPKREPYTDQSNPLYPAIKAFEAAIKK